MAAAAKASAGLNKKLGPLPVKVWVALAAALLVVLYLRHRAQTTSKTSAGTNAGTDTAGLSSYPNDSLGGAGGAVGPDLSALLASIDANTAAVRALGGGTTVPVAGANTSPGAREQSAQPSSSFTGEGVIAKSDTPTPLHDPSAISDAFAPAPGTIIPRAPSPFATPTAVSSPPPLITLPTVTAAGAQAAQSQQLVAAKTKTSTGTRLPGGAVRAPV